MRMMLSASLASADPLRLAWDIDRLQGWENLHFDLEDGNFTPNVTFGQRTLAAAAKYIRPRRLDVHLMVTDPLVWLPELEHANVGSVCAHVEALRFPLLFLNGAKAQGMKAGLAVNFATPLDRLMPFLPDMDFVLVMTAEPDGAGERLNGTALAKAVHAAKTLPVPVFADGGMTEAALAALSEAGATGAVVGRLLFQAENPALQMEKLDRLVQGGKK
jgi:ribulose-phosphate 3-epimerase